MSTATAVTPDVGEEEIAAPSVEVDCESVRRRTHGDRSVPQLIVSVSEGYRSNDSFRVGSVG